MPDKIEIVRVDFGGSDIDYIEWRRNGGEVEGCYTRANPQKYIIPDDVRVALARLIAPHLNWEKLT
jgi:hypothetical protein